ncbi:hypothetical protein OG689_19555 [Kitasatospora sp. NBC_00240]|uniref:hypothetical protein n=1 Tax=Kitasatospora sp. NBC_00240 TaxID=2903567 RepID=UPI0022545648|nr:hypothetical protein [Kitasatospora sp. NBC_00240]MCX5211458.1 hypothetical protein [Kitasatospora sp. NBC_00240]
MSEDEWRDGPAGESRGTRQRRVRLPGFVTDEEIGLGDAVRQVTYAMGLRRPCGGCERRAAALNRRVLLVRGAGGRRGR